MTKLPIEDLYSDEMLRNIGIFIMTCATCENVLAFQLMRLVAHPREANGYDLFPFMGTETKVKLKLISDLATLKLPSHSEKIGKACNKIRKSFNHRNQLAHYSNGPQDENHIGLNTMRLQSDGTLEGVKKINKKQIKQYAKSLLERINVLVGLLTEAGVEPMTEFPEPLPARNG